MKVVSTDAVPEFRVTGVVGAVGQTILTFGGLISASVEAQPCPVSPRPCKKMSVAVCWPLAAITTCCLSLLLLLMLNLNLESNAPMQQAPRDTDQRKLPRPMTSRVLIWQQSDREANSDFRW